MTDLSQWVVLLVDDEPDSLNLMHDMLIHYGAAVYRAGNSTEALAVLNTLTPTLIVLDLAMPKPDGWDVLVTIRANPLLKSVPIVAITAYYSEKVAEQASRAGFNAIIAKPVKMNSLLAQLQQVVDHK